MSWLDDLMGGSRNGGALLGAQAYERLQPFLRALFLEYGSTGCDVRPHDPADAPTTHYAQIAEGNSVTVDVEDRLGKVATRGHISNVGNGRLIVDWKPWGQDTHVGAYRLPPGAVLDTSSWFVRSLLITAEQGEGDGEVQILAQ